MPIGADIHVDSADFSCGCGACCEDKQDNGNGGVTVQELPGVEFSGPVDTITGDTSTGESVALGGSATGYIGPDGSDRDWFSVQLTAGESYQFALDGSGGSALSDPYLRLYDSAGNFLALNDDGGAGRNSLLNFTATSSGTYYLSAGSWNDSSTGEYTLSANVAAPLEEWSLSEISDFLTDGYWNSNGGVGRSWAIDTITYNVTGLTADGQNLARLAFDAWEDVADLTFVETAGSANMTLDDDQTGAFSSSSTSGSTIVSSTINVGTGWLSTYGTGTYSYSYQTYIHEIGHSLGLGHAGPYNGSATYGTDNIYLNDSWAYTVMSYFDQNESGYGSYRLVMSAQLADIVAVQNLYGAATTRSGDTVYGFNSTAGNIYDLTLYANAPALTIFDSSGTDTLDLSGYSSGQTISLVAGSFSSVGGYTTNFAIASGVLIENAIGGSGVDSITGNTAGNELSGGGGDDTLTGGGGNDMLNGGVGNDTLRGDGGIDTLFGNDGNDILRGGDSDDTLNGNDGIDDLAGGSGNDLMSGGAGDDTLVGQLGNDTLNGDGGNDTLSGNNGDDTLDGGDGNDTLAGDSGTDTASYTSATSGVSVNLNIIGAQNTLGAGTDTLTSIENLTGSGLGDTLIGDNNDNVINGGAGNDILRGNGGVDTMNGGSGIDDIAGGGGNDVMSGGAGNDTLVGQLGNDTLSGDDGDDNLSGNAGNDTLDGGVGNDTLNGGPGSDTASYASATGGVSVNLNIPGAQNTLSAGADTLISIENLTGSGFNDTLRGNGLDNVLDGGDGVDILRGNGGHDTMNGGGGIDDLAGGAGNDVLSGGAGNDTLVGQLGNDTLNGGSGDDSLSGNNGVDSFVFNSGWGNDAIRDFGNGSELISIVGTGLTAGDLDINVVGSDTVVDFIGVSDSITLIGITSGIDQNDFDFV